MSEITEIQIQERAGKIHQSAKDFLREEMPSKSMNEFYFEKLAELQLRQERQDAINAKILECFEFLLENSDYRGKFDLKKLIANE